MQKHTKYNYKHYLVKVELVNGRIDKYSVTDINRINATKQIANYLYKRNVAYNKIESVILNNVPLVVPNKNT